VEIADAQALFSPAGTYLNTASYGLPPRPAWDALHLALADWRDGRTSWEHWQEETDVARAAFARLVHVPPEQVAVSANVSSLVGLVAASIPDGSQVLTPDVEFTSAFFPFLAQAHRGVTVRYAPADALVDAIDADTDVVVFSAVQMATGEVADLDGLVAAAEEHDVLTIVDATQAVGWLELNASRFDVVVVAAYKWLLTLRGTAYMALRPSLLERITPISAGWYAGEVPFETYYGPPLRLAATARRLDTSPAWHSWIVAAQSLAVIEQVGVEQIARHDLALANRFREGLGLAPSNSAIVYCDVENAAEKLARADIRAAVRGGRLRTSWHLYNTVADVEWTLDALSA
jgi:selenocysteine lyase/cysteine desulfurase